MVLDRRDPALPSHLGPLVPAHPGKLADRIRPGIGVLGGRTDPGDRQIVEARRSDNHSVLSADELAAGSSGEWHLVATGRGKRSGAVFLTTDKDFGELVFWERLPTPGLR